MVRAFAHGVDPLDYISFRPVLHDWCNKGRVMCHPLCGMVHIKEPLLLIGKSSPCVGSRFPLSLSELSFTLTGNKRTTTKSGSQMEQPRAKRQKARRQISNRLRPNSNVKKGTPNVFRLLWGEVE